MDEAETILKSETKTERRSITILSIRQVPSAAGPARTSLAIEAPNSHHVYADRVDESRHGWSSAVKSFLPNPAYSRYRITKEIYRVVHK